MAPMNLFNIRQVGCLPAIVATIVNFILLYEYVVGICKMSATNSDAAQEKKIDRRGWVKGKKRKPYTKEKDDNAPRRPVNGYVRYMTEKRESVTLQNPDLSFADVTKLLGNQWTSLPMESKQKYLDDAETDRADYLQKLKKYQQTSQYKDHMQKLADKQQEDSVAGPSRSPVQRKQSVTPPVGNKDIPIFTEAFLDHNKAKDAELRQLRKSNAEYEEQNTILQRHIKHLQNAITRLDSETQMQRQSNFKLQMKLHTIREMVVKMFKDMPLPESGMLPTMKTVDTYMKQVHQILLNPDGKHKDFAASVKEIMLKISKNDLQLLFVKV
ncbi:high mobility group protein 20A-like [Styela clava]